MKIIGNKIILSIDQIFPQEGLCDPKKLDETLTFIQTHQSYQQFAHPLIFHLLSQKFPPEQLKYLHGLIGKSNIIKILSDIQFLKTAKEIIIQLGKLHSIINGYSVIKKLLDLFKHILNQELTIATHKEYLKLFKLFLEFMNSLYPSLKFLKDAFFNGTPVQFKPNPILTNCYAICAKQKNLSLETLSEKLMGKELSKSVDTLIINGFSYLSNKTAQQEILNLLFITLKQNTQIIQLQFNDSFLDNQSTSYILEGLQNTAVAELIFHKSTFNPFYQKNEPAFSSIRKNSSLVSLRCYDCDTPPATHIKEIAAVLGAENTLSSLHIGGKTVSAHCSYCNSANENLDDGNEATELIHFSAASVSRTANGGLLCNDAKDIPEAINRLLNTLVEKNPSFELSLTRKTVTTKNIPALCQILKQATNLKKLDLTYNYNESGYDFAKALASLYIIPPQAKDEPQEQYELRFREFLKIYQETSLQELNLSMNNIGDEGCIAIAKLLEYNTSIKILNLANNYITDLGAKALGEALLHNRTLETLDLSNNNIRTEVAILVQESKLKHLFIQGNRLIFKETSQLIEFLTDNHSLESIGFDLRLDEDESVDGFNFSLDTDEDTDEQSDTLKKLLITLFEKNSTLTHLKLQSIDAEITDDEKTITNIIAMSKSLKNFEFATGFSVKKLQCVVKALAANNTLQSFMWHFDGLIAENYNTEEISEIFKTLKQNTSLTSFDIPVLLLDEFPKEEYYQTRNDLISRNCLLQALLTTAHSGSMQSKQFAWFKCGHSQVHFWKLSKNKFPLPATEDRARVQDNIRCCVGSYYLESEGFPLFQKLLTRAVDKQNPDKSAETLCALTSPLISDKLVASRAEFLNRFVMNHTNLVSYLLNQRLMAFNNIKKMYQENLTEYVNFVHEILIKSDWSETQILDCLNLFQKFFIALNEETLQSALEMLCGSELDSKTNEKILTLGHKMAYLQRDIIFMQKQLKKCQTIIDETVKTQLPKPDEEIISEFISQLQSKH